MTNSELKIHLEKKLKSGNFPHAILLSGPKHSGKFAFFKKLTAILLPSSFQRPPDLVMVDKLWQHEKEEDMEKIAQSSTFDQSHRKKEKKKTDTIGIEDVMAFTKQAFETTTAPYKVIVVRDVERMTEDAANNFLKILEEPPQKTVFLLTSSFPNRLLPTILSRVQHEKFSLATEEEMNIFLDTNNIHFHQKREDLKNMAAGRMEILERLIFEENFFETQHAIFNEVRKIFLLSPTKRLEEAEKWSETSQEERENLFFAFEIILNEHLKMQLSQANPQKKWITNETIFREMKQGISQNGNAKLLLEALFLNMEN